MSKDFDDHIRRLPAHLPIGVGHVPRRAEDVTGNTPINSLLLPRHENVIREYMGVFRKFRRIILAVTIAITLGSLVYAFLATPLYTAQSRIRISTYEPVLTATKIEEMLQQRSKEANYLDTQLEELKSYSLVDRVLADPAIGDFFTAILKRRGYKINLNIGEAGVTGYRAPVVMIKEYLKSITIRPVRRTSLVEIEATVEDPRVAALIAQKHALSYIEWTRSMRVDQQARSIKFLQTQADELRTKVADIERSMADYAEQNAIVAVNKDENIIAQKMSQLNQAVTEISTRRLEAEKLYQEAVQGMNSESAGFDDSSTQTMRSELAKLEGEYQQLSAKFMPGYPRMQQLHSQIVGLRSSIKAQRQQIVTGMKAKAEALAEQEASMREELEQQKSKAFDLSKKQVQYNILNRELTSSRELLESVLKQMKETGLSAESNASNVSIVDAPVVPIKPSYPQKSLVLFFGLFLGGALGIAIALILNHLDNSIRSSDEVINYLQLPSLGMVPSFELERNKMLTDERARLRDVSRGAGEAEGERTIAPVPTAFGSESAPIMFVQDPRSLAAEAYRTIRTSLLLSQAGEPPRTMLVTSAQSSEGKTTTSINLAASLASSGARVVLIDADLRRPSLHKQLGINGDRPGLVEVLTGTRQFAEVALREVIRRVTVVTSGTLPPNPAELLGSYEMLSLIGTLAQEFDYVVIDSPPILPVTDSVVLSRFVEGVVLVVRSGATPRKVVADARDRLLAVGARIFGSVLNDVDFKGGEYYYYNRYYQAYYERDDQGRKKAAS